ncbi:MAG: hypothetical protein ACK5PT_11035, partial [Cereibacter sp.]
PDAVLRAFRRGLINAVPSLRAIIACAPPFAAVASEAGLTPGGRAGFPVPGRAIPAGFAPDVAGPITVPAMIAPALRRLAHGAAARWWRLWPPSPPAR